MPLKACRPHSRPSWRNEDHLRPQHSGTPEVCTFGHQVEIAFERGWAELTNGELLAAVEADGFDLMITTDQGIRYQQNLAGRRLAILLIDTNDWKRIRRYKDLIVEVLPTMKAGDYVEVKIPRP